MNVESTIQWASPYSFVVLLGLTLGAVAALALLRWLWGRPIAPARRAGLAVVRLLILAAVASILLNPMRVDTIPGSVERSKLVYLVDSSQSMALGTGTTRWERVVQTIREAGARNAQVSVFRFGSRLAAMDAPFWSAREPSTGTRGSAGAALLAEEPASTVPPRRPPTTTRSFPARSRRSPIDSGKPLHRPSSSFPTAVRAIRIGPRSSRRPIKK